MVNGIYVLTEIIEVEKITLSAVVSGEKVTGIATMPMENIIYVTLIVALFSQMVDMIEEKIDLLK